jgi:GNAT superfamily N-acetyltransferase
MARPRSGFHRQRLLRCSWLLVHGLPPERSSGTFDGGQEPRRSQPRRPQGALVDAGNSHGLIAYHRKVPVGWVSLGPRDEFAKLKRSPVMKPVDDKPVWSVICFVVPSAHRGQGVAHALLHGAIAYARKHGATLIEAYPVDKAGRSRDDAMWFGAKSMYDRAGFQEVARRKPTRPVVRLKVQRGREKNVVPNSLAKG